MKNDYTISQKKKEQLYLVVNGKTTDARIKIARLLQDHLEVGKKVDEVLYQLGIEAPQSAINIFKTKSK